MSWLERIFGNDNSGTKKQQRVHHGLKNRPLTLEPLEARELLSVTPLGFSPEILPNDFRFPVPDVARSPEYEPSKVLLPQMVESGSLIGLDKLRLDPAFSSVHGLGYTTVIIDTGINLTHDSFKDAEGESRIFYSYDFADGDDDATDYDGHGSNVASIAAGSGILGIKAGVADQASIVALKVFPDAGGWAEWTDVEAALNWVIVNAETYNIVSVNLSLGSENFQGPISGPLNTPIKELYDMGIIVCAAAGNEFYEVGSTPGLAYPAIMPEVISVGAVFDASIGSNITWGSGAVADTTDADRVTPFSQRSELLTIMAPGALLTGAGISSNTSALHMTGTSQASPMVAGIAVLAQEIAQKYLGRNLTIEEFREILVDSAKTINDGDDEDDNVVNTDADYQRVDVYKMAQMIRAMSFEQLDTPVLKKVIPSRISVEIQWEVVADADSYTIEMATDQEFKNLVHAPWTNIPHTQTTLTVTGLEPDTTYYVRMKAIGDDVAFADSEYSNFGKFKTLAGVLPDVFEPNESWQDVNNRAENEPNSPKFGLIIGEQEYHGLTIDKPNDIDFYQFTIADVGTSEHYVQFTYDASEGLLELSLHDDKGVKILGVVDSETPISLEDLPKGVYYLCVKGVDVNTTNSYSLQLNTPVKAGATKLSAPTEIQAKDITSNGFSVSWKLADGTTKYAIEVGTDAGFTNIVYSGTVDGNSYVIDTLSPNREYYVRLRSLTTEDKYTSSDWSTVEVKVTTLKGDLSPPVITGAVLQGVAGPRGTNKIQVVWNGADHAEYYEIRYSTSPTFSSPVVLSNIQMLSSEIGGLNPNTTYYIQVRAMGGADYNNSGWSTTRTAPIPQITLPTPENVSLTVPATPAGINRLDISWDAVANCSGYEIEYATNAAFTTGRGTVSVTGSGTTSYQLTGRLANTMYYVRVRAIGTATGDYGNSGWSDVHSARTLKAAPTVTNFGVTYKTDTSLTLSFQSGTDVVSFQLQVQMPGSTNWVDVATLAGTATSYLHEGLLLGQNYSYRIQATNDQGTISTWYTLSNVMTMPMTHEEYLAVGTRYPELNLSAEWNNYNILVPDQTGNNTATNFQSALTAANTSTKSDLIVVRLVNDSTIQSTTTFTINTNATNYGNIMVATLFDYENEAYAFTLSGSDVRRVLSIGANANVSFSGVTISNGSITTGNGAGITNAGTLTLMDCVMKGNIAQATTSNGAGIYNNGTFSAFRTAFSDNQGNNGGAIYNAVTRLMSLTDCVLYVNRSYSATGNGSAIYNAGTISMTGCDLYDNRGINGGAIYNSGTVHLSRSNLHGNNATNGGAVYNSSATSTTTIIGCTFKENTALENGNNTGLGGAIYNNGTLNVSNSLLAINTADHSGGALYNVEGRSMTLTNCTISANTSSVGAGITNVGAGSLSIYNSVVSLNVNTSDSAKSGISGIITESVSNYIDMDPRFVVSPVFDSAGKLLNAETVDFHLSIHSHAIDTGTNSRVVGSQDLEGMARIYQGGGPTPYTVDIGAYEYSGSYAQRDSMSKWVVTTVNDNFDAADGEWSLREALYYARNGRVITFASGIVTAELYSELVIQYNVTIDGRIEGGELVTIHANETRIMSLMDVATNVTLMGLVLQGGSADYGGAIYVNRGARLTLRQVTLEDCLATYDGGAIYNAGTIMTDDVSVVFNTAGRNGGGLYNANGGVGTIGKTTMWGNMSGTYGGAIYNAGTMTTGESSLVANTAGQYGGGIANTGTITVRNTFVAENEAIYGGGLYNANNGIVTIEDATMRGNTSGTYGGAIYNASGLAQALVIRSSSIYGNSAGQGGGGIANTGMMTVLNTTVAENTATYGGGIYSTGTINLYSSTLVGNTGNYGMGLYVYSGNLVMNNSILANGVDIGMKPGATASGSFNLIGNGSGQTVFVSGLNGNIVGTASKPIDPKLTIKDEGKNGRYYYVPGWDSPVVGMGNADSRYFPNETIPTTDQTGASRLRNGLLDMGSVQFVSPITLPAKVSGLTSSEQKHNAISLKWEIAIGADGYVLQYRQAGSADWISAHAGQDYITETLYTLNGLKEGTEYQFRLQAIVLDPDEELPVRPIVGGSGWVTLYSSTRFVPPKTPENFKCDAYSENSVTLSWNAVSNATKYTLQYKKEGDKDWTTYQMTTATNVSVTGLQPNTMYHFRVQAANNNGASVYSETVSVKTGKPVAPSIPENFEWTARSIDYVVLQWEMVADAESYDLRYRIVGAENWTLTDSTSRTSATIAGLKSASDYEFQVRARSWAGSSDWAVCQVSTLENVPDVPTNLRTVKVTPNSVELSWDSVENVISYDLQYRRTGEESWTVVSGIEEPHLTVTGLSSNTAYEFQIRAVTKDCPSDWSGVLSVKTMIAVPTKPTNFRAVSATADSVSLQWNAGLNAASYKIEILRPGEANWTVLEEAWTSLSYVSTGLTANTSYQYRITAVNATGISESVVITAKTLLASPANLQGVANGAAGVVVNWDVVQGATNYEIQRFDATENKWVAIGTTDQRTWTDSSAQENVLYQYRVFATGDEGSIIGQSAPSSVLSVYNSESTVASVQSQLFVVDSKTAAKGSYEESLANQQVKVLEWSEFSIEIWGTPQNADLITTFENCVFQFDPKLFDMIAVDSVYYDVVSSKDDVTKDVTISGTLKTGAENDAKGRVLLARVHFVPATGNDVGIKKNLENGQAAAVDSGVTVSPAFDLTVQKGSTLNVVSSDLVLRPLMVTPFLADFNDDGMVNASDFLMFAKAFGKSVPINSEYEKYDIVKDGIINSADFLAFAKVYGQARPEQVDMKSSGLAVQTQTRQTMSTQSVELPTLPTVGTQITESKMGEGATVLTAQPVFVSNSIVVDVVVFNQENSLLANLETVGLAGQRGVATTVSPETVSINDQLFEEWSGSLDLVKPDNQEDWLIAVHPIKTVLDVVFSEL